jgi:hypothetical protein
LSSAVGGVGRHARPHTSTRWPWRSAAGTRGAADLRTELHLPRGERVLLTLIGTGAADAVAGTDRALYWKPSGANWLRLGWEEISRVGIEPTTSRLVVATISDGVPRRAVLPVPVDARLLAFVQERVSATRIVLTRIVVDGRELPVDARRRPATGELYWLVTVDAALARSDRLLASKIEHALAELGSSLGLDGCEPTADKPRTHGVWPPEDLGNDQACPRPGGR